MLPAESRVADPDPGAQALLPPPRALRADFPLCPRSQQRIRETRRAFQAVLEGRDPRLAVIVGPCSLHHRESALEYAGRLAEVAGRSEDALLVLMRAYVEKPRTGVGWKGLLNDPDLDGSCDVARGLRESRSLLRDLNAAGVACAAEIVSPWTAPYLEDCLAWGAVGARTVESQTHRELASGLGLPVGMKNRCDGDVLVAVQAATAARVPHVHAQLDADGQLAVAPTPGNPGAHVVLRGGSSGPNHHRAAVAEALQQARVLELARPIVVDCSHGNSGKLHTRQAGVLGTVLELVASGAPGVAGVALESHLRPGRQVAQPGRQPARDRSVTDACIGWGETESLLERCAETVRRAREAGSPGSRARCGERS
ncbi:MAG: 3-deoxy-7-phosphoheptulonate synthase [Proteobacteria bacterium]|nr:3-deoxy-7-phosphoheptulonate synthase [Pseudomonadota bacterium]